MSEPQAVQLTLAVAMSLGGLIAWGACLYANRLDKREGKPMGEAPSILTAPVGIAGIVGVFMLASSGVVRAQTYMNGCDLVDPSTLSWAKYLMYLAAGCGW